MPQEGNELITLANLENKLHNIYHACNFYLMATNKNDCRVGITRAVLELQEYIQDNFKEVAD